MGKWDRLMLQQELETLLGSSNVYFQPPSSIRMSYPAIVYELSNIDNRYADNVVYKQSTAYQVTVIDANPDSEIPGRISRFPTSRFVRTYRADNLNHWVFTLYY